jgi:hypothetical protein
MDTAKSKRPDDKPRSFNRAARRALGLYTRRFKADRRAPKAIAHPMAGRPIRRSVVIGL